MSDSLELYISLWAVHVFGPRRRKGTLVQLSSEELLVHRYNDLLTGVNDARDGYDIVNLGAILRQLLLDGLVDRANQNHRIKLRFVINRPSAASELPVKPDILFHGEAINPRSITTAKGQESVKLDGFLKLVIIEIEGEQFTVKDIIKYAANKAGGVHFDPNLDERETTMQETLDRLGLYGISPLANAVLSISKVVLSSLARFAKRL